MSRLTFSSLMFIGILAAGCSSTKKTTTRTHVTYSTSAQTELYGAREKQKDKGKAAETGIYQPLNKKALKTKYAALLKVRRKDIKNRQLYSFIDAWLGIKYKWGGNDKNGVDCSGFAQQLYRNVYNTYIVRTSLEQHEKSRTFRRKQRLREGDLIFFRPTGEKVSHVGVYLQNNYFVHVSISKGVTISNLGEKYWRQCFVCGGKMSKK